MLNGRDGAGCTWLKTADQSSKPEPPAYSLDAIIALQKALEEGIPEGFTDNASSCRLLHDAKTPRPSIAGKSPAVPGRASFLNRVLRRALAAMKGSARTLGNGNSW